MILWTLTLVSTILFLGTAFVTSLTYPNLYSAVAGLTDNAIKTEILVTFACTIAALWTWMIIKLFLGGITDNEKSIIYQKGWLFCCNLLLFWGTNTLRQHDNIYNIGVYVLSLFVLLVLHWVCQTRCRNIAAQVMEPTFSFFFQRAKFAVLAVAFVIIDFALLATALNRAAERDYSYAAFCFVLIDLVEDSTTLLGQFVINTYSAYYLYKFEDEEEWEKQKILNYGIKLLCIFGALIMHLRFMGLEPGSGFTVNGTFIFRAIRLTNQGAKFLRALRASKEVETFTTKPTEADLGREATCVVCRDEMDLNAGSKMQPRKLGCGHTMHLKCLTAWMARSPSCPTCRQPVKDAVSTFKSAEPAAQTPGEQPTRQTEQPEQQPDQHTPSSVSGPVSEPSLFNAQVRARTHPEAQTPTPTTQTPLQSTHPLYASQQTQSIEERVIQVPFTIHNDAYGMLNNKYLFTFEN